jgi:glycosyltransferase involved in cell wall biosynthesis
VLWSILISGIPERYHVVQPLLYSLLESQAVARMSDIELIYLMDNRRRSVGAKRNALLDMAAGDYISFIDDDDDVSPDYVRRIHDALVDGRRTGKQPDVVCFGQRATLAPHGVVHECSYSIAHVKREPRRQLAPAPGPDGQPLPDVLLWSGPPAHTMVWRRELVRDIRFPDAQFGEDAAWCDVASERAKSEVQLGSVLYNYKFNPETSATR